MNPELVRQELRRLSRLNVDAWNESDVREDFLAKLLSLLGYQKGSDYDINREGSHLLSRPFLYVGRKRIDIDYALMVRRRRFWIIEAKAPNPPALEEQAVFQAHFYALHPEVAARYFLVSNAKETQLYDLRNLGDDYRPVLTVRLHELEAGFSELNAVLGAGQIRGVLRERLMDDMRDVLSTEVRDEALGEFERRVGQIVRDARQVVRANWRTAYRNKSAEDDAALARELASAGSAEQLVRVGFEFPDTLHEFELVRGVFDDFLRNFGDARKAQVFGYVCDVLSERPRATLQTNLVHLLLHYGPNFEQITTQHSGRSLFGAVKRAMQSVLSDFAADPLAKQLGALEDNLFRVTYKATFSEKLREVLKATAEGKSKLLQEEDLVRGGLSAASERVRFVKHTVALAYDRLARLDEAALRDINVRMEIAERAVEADFREGFAKRSRDERDLMFFDSYGKPFDARTSSFCNTLCNNFRTVEPLIDDDIEALLVAKLRPRPVPYSVNYVDTLLVKLWAARGAVDVDSGVQQFLDLHGVGAADVCQRLHIDRQENLGFRAWGELKAGRYSEIRGVMDLDRKQLRFTEAKDLK